MINPLGWPGGLLQAFLPESENVKLYIRCDYIQFYFIDPPVQPYNEC
jgi:hypothetical protein